jgi:hypothetical protein
MLGLARGACWLLGWRWWYAVSEVSCGVPGVVVLVEVGEPGGGPAGMGLSTDYGRPDAPSVGDRAPARMSDP